MAFLIGFTLFNILFIVNSSEFRQTKDIQNKRFLLDEENKSHHVCAIVNSLKNNEKN